MGDQTELAKYVRSKVIKWSSQINAVTQAAESFPHEAFSAISRSIQSKWSFLSRVVPDAGQYLGDLEEAVRSTFLTKLLQNPISDDNRLLYGLPARMGGLGISNPADQARDSYATSAKANRVLAEAIVHNAVLDVSQHKAAVQQSRREHHIKRTHEGKEIYGNLLSKASSKEKKRLERHFETKTSSWLTTPISSRDGFVLTKNEFNDNLCLRYSLPFQNLPSKCDGCSGDFSVQHALSCKRGGLVSIRHNEIRDVIGDLAALAWPCVTKEPEIKAATEMSPGLRADLLVRGVWHPQQYASFDLRVTDTDASSYGDKSSQQVLRAAEEEKKSKYLNACEMRHVSFTPLVASVDGLLAPAFQHFLKVLAGRLAEKWDKPYSKIASWIRTRLSFAIFRATNLCIRGTRAKWNSLRFEDGAGVGE